MRTIARKDESFDNCSFPEADVRLLARVAMVAMNRGKCGKAMELLARRPWGPQALRLMIDARPNIVSVTEVDEGEHPGATLLHYAADDTRPSLVAVLLDAGADPDARDGCGWSPLGYACRNREHGATLAAHLLEAGADVNVRLNWDRTPLHIAAACSWASSVEVCKLLIAEGIDVNARNADGQTALEYAVAHAIPRCVATLLEAGAEQTRGALKAAMREGSPRGLQMLFRADRTCIYWALEWMEEYRTIFGASIKYNVAYVDRIWAGGSKLDGFLCYERDQRRALATIVQRHVAGHRLPPEMSEIIAAFWGHPGGYVVF